jgi:hypothetical protein
MSIPYWVSTTTKWEFFSRNGTADVQPQQRQRGSLFLFGFSEHARNRIGAAVLHMRRCRQAVYCPNIPFFKSALGGLGPSHTENSTGPNAGFAMVTLSLPLSANVVPLPGR